MDSVRLGAHLAASSRLGSRLPPSAPVAWLTLGLAVWAVGLFEPGNLMIDATIVAVLAGVLLLVIAEPRLAEVVLIALSLVTPTITMIAAGLTDRLRDTAAEPSPMMRVITVIVLVSVPSLVGAFLIAHTRIDG